MWRRSSIFLAWVTAVVLVFLACDRTDRSAMGPCGLAPASPDGGHCIIADNPTITTYNNQHFNWPNWHAWWIRADNRWVEFTFCGLDTLAIPSENVSVSFNLGVTNRASGEGGLDGLLDIVVNSGDPDSILQTDILFDNVDPTNTVLTYYLPWAYETRACVSVPKTAIVNGELPVRVLRHTGISGPSPDSGRQVPIDLCTTPPTVPSGVYLNDDPRTVHIEVRTTDATGTVAASGEVFLTSLKVTPSTFNKRRHGRWITVHTWCPEIDQVEIVAVNGCHDGLPISGQIQGNGGVVKFDSGAVGSLLPVEDDVEICVQITLADGTVYRSCDTIDVIDSDRPADL